MEKLRSVLRHTIRQAAKKGNVQSPRNVKVVINTGRDGEVTTAESSQHVNIAPRPTDRSRRP